jgi:rhodanese-related sulfurtransferase
MNVKRFFFPAGTPLRLMVIVAASALLAGFRSILVPVGDDVRSVSQEIPSLDVKALHQLGVPILWIDARSEKEFQADHIPGALWLNETDFESGIDGLLDRWSPETALVVYCSSKTCNASQHLASRLKQSGFSVVYVLEGGWEAWQKR